MDTWERVKLMSGLPHFERALLIFSDCKYIPEAKQYRNAKRSIKMKLENTNKCVNRNIYSSYSVFVVLPRCL